MAYLLDANVFIQAKNRHYGFDFCPAFWDWLDRAHADGLVFSIEKVRDELIGGDDELAEWSRPRDAAFFLQPDPVVLGSLRQLSVWCTTDGYEPAAVATFLASADYYLVGHAHAHGHAVVTHEVVAHTTKKVKIPNACVGVGVKCMTPFEMLRAERARFVL